VVGLTGKAHAPMPCDCGATTPSAGGPTAAMVRRDTCPECGARQVKHNGPLHSGPQHPQGQAGARPGVAHAAGGSISGAQRVLLAYLRRECSARCGMCRAVGVRLTWLLGFQGECVAACPAPVHRQLPGRPSDVGLRPRQAEADAQVARRREAGEPPRALARHGGAPAPGSGVVCGRPASQAWGTARGKDPRRRSPAGQRRSRRRCGRPRGQSPGSAQRHDAASP
jgi:hypothetical protein